MNSLPLHILDEILFGLEPKSLAMFQCTNKSLHSYIYNPDFESEYFSRFGSGLFILQKYGAKCIYCQDLVSSCDSRSLRNIAQLITTRCCIFGSCSGLLLLYIDGLFIANPLTKRFQKLDHSGSKLLPKIVGNINRVGHMDRSMCIGFAVDQNLTTKRFKIVCILEMETVYRFEISDGDSWRLSETTITASSKSDLLMGMKPVYFDGVFHWLRNNGSILAFNPETEQAHLIPSLLHQEPNTTVLLFAIDDKIIRLILIVGTNEDIYIYTLLENSKWILARRIQNIWIRWNVVAYDTKHLVVWENITFSLRGGVVYVYDMEANSWGVLGYTEWFFETPSLDFYMFTPSLFFVQDDEHNDKMLVETGDDLRSIMGLIDTSK